MHLAWFALLCFLCPNLAKGDVPPDDGQKYVSYAFRVEKLASFPDYVMLAYPWSLSNGAPTREHTRVEAGKNVYVGRRSDDPRLYAMKRADYAKWLEGYTATGEYGNDPALEALFAGPKVVRCQGAKPSPRFEVSDSYPREEVLDVLKVVQMDASGCRVEASAAASSEAAANQAKSPNTSKGGCAGCSVPDSTRPSGPAWASVALGLLALRRRRPKRRGVHRVLELNSARGGP